MELSLGVKILGGYSVYLAGRLHGGRQSKALGSYLTSIKCNTVYQRHMLMLVGSSWSRSRALSLSHVRQSATYPEELMDLSNPLIDVCVFLLLNAMQYTNATCLYN